MVSYRFAKHDSSNLEGQPFKIFLLWSQMVIILGNYLHILSLPVLLLVCGNINDNTFTTKCGCIPVKLYKNQWGRIGPGSCLWTPETDLVITY